MMMSRKIEPSVKPSVLSTPISPVRSRTAVTIVFAAISRMVNTTARPMMRSANGTLPYMLTKLAPNACSLSVSVAASEFSNIASTCFAIAAERDGSETSSLNTPMYFWPPMPFSLR